MATNNNNNAAIIGTAIIIATLVIAGAIIIVSTQTIGSHGRVNTTPGVEVFKDEACTLKLTDIDWGSLNPGDKAAITFYIKNTGNLATTFTFTVNEWSPPHAAQYMTITWTYAGETVYPWTSMATTMYLETATNIVDVTDFSNSITISVVK